MVLKKKKIDHNLVFNSRLQHICSEKHTKLLTGIELKFGSVGILKAYSPGSLLGIIQTKLFDDNRIAIPIITLKHWLKDSYHRGRNGALYGWRTGELLANLLYLKGSLCLVCIISFNIYASDNAVLTEH